MRQLRFGRTGKKARFVQPFPDGDIGQNGKPARSGRTGEAGEIIRHSVNPGGSGRIRSVRVMKITFQTSSFLVKVGRLLEYPE